MKALVTGGAGFIGSHLVDLLLTKGHSVIVIDNYATGRSENLREARSLARNGATLLVHNADVGNLRAIAPYFRDVDWVFHLAGLADIVPSIERPLDYYGANVTGTVNVLEAARLCGVKRFVYAASSSCYGIPDAYPTSEEASIRPQYPYALTKWMGEAAAFHWGRVYRLPVASLRLFNVYGPRARTSGAYGAVFGVFLAQRLHRKPLTIVGDGMQERDFVFVTDVAEAFLKVAESDVSGEALNIGYGSPVSINRIASMIGGERVYVPKRPGEPDRTHASIGKIVKSCGWRPTVAIEEGIARMLSEIERWRDAPVWTPELIAQATRLWFEHLASQG